MIQFQPVRTRGQGASLVEQVVDAFTQAIGQRQLLPGMAVPSVRQFAREHDVSTFTVASAYARLVALGWLVSRPGAGYRVATPMQAASASASSPAWTPPKLNASWLLSDIYADHSIPIKAGCGWLPGEWLNEEGLHLALRHLGRVPALRITGYGQPYGHAPLRETIAASLAVLGMQADTEQVLLTQGVTRGLDLVIRTFLRPGDTVVVEDPCYANLLQLLRLAGIRIVAVRRTEQGFDAAALERAVRLHQPRVIFVSPVLHNPSGATFSMAQAFQLLQLAERHDCLVVEDDISRELLPGMAPMLAALDGARRVIYLGGYSKVISPSVRVGYVVAHRDVVRDLARTKMAVGLTSPEIMERVVHHVIREGRYRAHILRTRERLAQAHADVLQHMDESGFEPAIRPHAGLFLWAKARGSERGANALAEEALAHGIWLAPGSYFDAGEADVPWLRFNVAYAGHAQLWTFLRQKN